MKKQRYDAYANYYYKVDKKKKRKAKFLSILFVIISILIVIFFSFSFSNFLIVSKIVNINSNFIYEDKTLYAVSLYSNVKTNELSGKVDEIQKQGGAGFIFEENDKFFILSSIYDNKKDALKVQNNLKNSGIESEILEIILPKIDFKISLTSYSINKLNNALELFFNSYKNLYNLSVSYDSKEMDIVEIKSNINNLIATNNQVINEYINNFNKASNVYILYVKIYLNQLIDILKDLNLKDESSNFSSEIKYSYCKVIDCYLNLFNEM